MVGELFPAIPSQRFVEFLWEFGAPIHYTESQKALMWERWRQGDSSRRTDRYTTGILLTVKILRQRGARRSERDVRRGTDSFRQLAQALDRRPGTLRWLLREFESFKTVWRGRSNVMSQILAKFCPLESVRRRQLGTTLAAAGDHIEAPSLNIASNFLRVKVALRTP